MTSPKCLQNSVSRFVIITILVSIFSQSFDCASTRHAIIGTLEEGSSSHIIDNGNDTIADSNSVKSSKCTGLICVDLVPRKVASSIDVEYRDRRRLVDVGANDKNANDAKYNDKDRPVSPVDLLYTLEGYKITMDPSVKKISEEDYQVILNVNVVRKWDNRKEMELPSISLPLDVLLGNNSSIEKMLKDDLKNSVSINNNRDIPANFENLVTTPTDIGLKTDEDPTQPTNIDLSNQKDQNNKNFNVVTSSTSSTSDRNEGVNNEDNDFVTTKPTTSTSIEPLINRESNPSITPLPPNEEEMRNQEKPSSGQPGIITTPVIRIATPNPIDLITASTLVNLVRQSQTPHATSNVLPSSTEVSKAVESRVISSTSSSLNSDSSSIKPKMSENELNHLKSLYEKKTDKPVKRIPETPWVPAYEVKPIGFNKQDNNHIEYRFSQHNNEADVRRNIPNNQPKSRPQPQPEPKLKLKPQLQPQPKPQPQPQLRYEAGKEMRANNDHPNTYVPMDPRASLKNRQANAPNSRIKPYAVEEIVHFERPIQRLNTRQYKPTPELFVRIIRHYFDNALSPAETVYTTRHKSPIIVPGQPLYQRSQPSLSYRNSKS